MIHILAHFEVKKEEISRFLELCSELIQESRKESGCIAYNLHQSNENENNFVFVEEWKTENDIQSHNSSQHFVKIVPLLVSLCEKDPVITTYSRVF